MTNYKEYNSQILMLISYFLNYKEKSITQQDVQEIMKSGVSEVEAYTIILIAILGVEDNVLIREYFYNMIEKLSKTEFENNPYYKHIKFSPAKLKEWEIKSDYYSRYELFVKDDFKYVGERVIPNLGFFSQKFSYPAVYQNGRLWMSVTPNEINTMKEPIQKASGDVLTFGLGLGYFAYMCSLKDDVSSVTIIERDSSVIELFNKYILPQFEHKEKIKIIKIDAFEYLENNDFYPFDFVFVDIYHDAGDGKEVYQKFIKYQEKAKCKHFDFWIEKTIKYYL